VRRKGIVLAGGAGEIAFRAKFIDATQLERVAQRYQKTAYGDYLLALLRE
jgi:hypothetical protein